jgi:hypothetical protein
MEAIVQGSRLDWTIVRPPQLTDKPSSGKSRVLVGHLPYYGFHGFARGRRRLHDRSCPAQIPILGRSSVSRIECTEVPR